MEGQGGGGGQGGGVIIRQVTLVSVCVRTCVFLSGSWHSGHMVSLVQMSQLEQEGEVTILLLMNFVCCQP